MVVGRRKGSGLGAMGGVGEDTGLPPYSQARCVFLQKSSAAVMIGRGQGNKRAEER